MTYYLTGKTIGRWFLLCLVIFMNSCHPGGERKEGGNEIDSIPEPYDITEAARLYADSVLKTMTVEEKVGQCLMPPIYAREDSSTLRLYKKYMEDYHVGGVVLMKGDKHAARNIAEIGKEAKVPLFVAMDAEWGLGMRLSDGETYPKNGNFPKDLEDSELFDYGREVARESRETGINMILGPVVDITSNPRSVIGSRSFGNDPGLVSDYAVAYAKGLESGGVVSVAKHFPGHGGAFNDSHAGVAKIYKGITALDSVDLKPFREYINAGLNGVMAGHIQSLALDPDGTPASVSIDMLSSLLREEMGFKGLILTDSFTMGGAHGFSTAEALNAGADIVLCPPEIEKEYKKMIENIQDGSQDIDVINDRCRRILFTKFLFGLIP